MSQNSSGKLITEFQNRKELTQLTELQSQMKYNSFKSLCDLIAIAVVLHFTANKPNG
jgi:hypothetical protein